MATFFFTLLVIEKSNRMVLWCWLVFVSVSKSFRLISDRLFMRRILSIRSWKKWPHLKVRNRITHASVKFILLNKLYCGRKLAAVIHQSLLTLFSKSERSTCLLSHSRVFYGQNSSRMNEICLFGGYWEAVGYLKCGVLFRSPLFDD